MAKWLTGKITKIEDQSPTTKRFWLTVPEVEKIDFKAGQFVVMDLPIHEKRLKRWRSYSIATHPQESNELEFSIVRLEGGLGTSYLFDIAEVGTEIKFKEPSGIFTLPEDVGDKNLVFVCTGTGVAPFRSMIWDLLNNKKKFRNIHLIFGTREAEGILYKEEFEMLASVLPNFKYDIALSREEVEEYYSGYVHQIYQEKYAVVHPTVQFYLCGWSKMIDEAVENLTQEMGYEKSQVVFELYG